MIRVLVLCAMLAAASASQAQSTGRHRPAAAPADTVAMVVASPWHIVLNFGAASAGDLFRVRAGGAVPWDPEGGAPFGSAEFVATLDEGFAYGVSILRDLSPWFALRADAAFTELPLTAEARVGETVRIFEYDDVALTSFTVGLEAKLTRSPSYPFLTAALGTTIADAAGSEAYDQTVLAGRYGAGWHQVLSQALAFRLEVCNTMLSLDFEDYRPPSPLPIYPAATVEDLGPQSILRLQAGLVASF